MDRCVSGPDPGGRQPPPRLHSHHHQVARDLNPTSSCQEPSPPSSSPPPPSPNQRSLSKKPSSKPLGVGGSAGSHPERAPGCNLVWQRRCDKRDQSQSSYGKGARPPKKVCRGSHALPTLTPHPEGRGFALRRPRRGTSPTAWTPLLHIFFPQLLHPLKDNCLQMLQDLVLKQLPFLPAGASSFLVLVRGPGNKPSEAGSARIIVFLSWCANLR